MMGLRSGMPQSEIGRRADESVTVDQDTKPG